jgi:hypothetical protein
MKGMRKMPDVCRCLYHGVLSPCFCCGGDQPALDAHPKKDAQFLPKWENIGIEIVLLRGVTQPIELPRNPVTVNCGFQETALTFLRR